MIVHLIFHYKCNHTVQYILATRMPSIGLHQTATSQQIFLSIWTCVYSMLTQRNQFSLETFQDQHVDTTFPDVPMSLPYHEADKLQILTDSSRFNIRSSLISFILM